MYVLHYTYIQQYSRSVKASRVIPTAGATDAIASAYFQEGLKFMEVLGKIIIKGVKNEFCDL